MIYFNSHLYLKEVQFYYYLHSIDGPTQRLSKLLRVTQRLIAGAWVQTQAAQVPRLCDLSSLKPKP